MTVLGSNPHTLRYLTEYSEALGIWDTSLDYSFFRTRFTILTFIVANCVIFCKHDGKKFRNQSRFYY